MRAVSLIGVVAILLLPFSAVACWDEAAQRYGVAPQLLYAMARVESGLDARAVNRSHLKRTGSYDIGLLQINSSNLPVLRRHGINEHDLHDPCTNIQVGAWLLAQKFAQHGVSWEGVGAYNAACSQLKGEACRAARSRYAWAVYKHLPHLDKAPSSAGHHPVVASAPLLAVKVAP
jgi:soluble lytic murein transglycosylase-like protein